MNIKIDFDNIVVKEDRNDFNVKVLMLKGEKGDTGDGENNVIEKVQVNGVNLPVSNKTVNVIVPNDKMDNIRKNNYSRYAEVVKPQNYLTSSFFDNFKIYTNNEGKYAVDYDIENFKNQGGSTYYISPNGNNFNPGTSEEQPKKNLAAMANVCSAGDTIICLDGIYNKDAANATISKSINIIAKNKGKVWFKTCSDLTYTKVDGYEHVYTTTRSGVLKVWNISQREKGIFTELTAVNSIANVESTEDSYYINSNQVYLHLHNDIIPSDDNINLSISLGANTLTFNNFTQDTKIYIEGINMLDANNGGIVTNNATNYDVYLTVKNCKIYNNLSNSYAYDGVSNKGCYSICDNVEIYNGGKDGFNYHAGSNKQAIGIEIDCIATDFGLGRTSSSQLSNNATTAHESSETIRVNGIYGYCNGGCVADVNSTKGIMYGCIIFDSYGQSYDVLAQTDSTLYLYDCYLKGSRATYNLLTSGTNAHIYYKNTQFDTKTGNVTELS